MEVLTVKYGTGEISVVVDGFFPCTLQKSKIIFPLIRDWCSEETKKELMGELVELRDGYAALEKMYEGREGRHWKAEYKRMATMRKRMERNIEWLEKVSRQ